MSDTNKYNAPWSIVPFLNSELESAREDAFMVVDSIGAPVNSVNLGARKEHAVLQALAPEMEKLLREFAYSGHHTLTRIDLQHRARELMKKLENT